MKETKTIYLIVHELFGVIHTGRGIRLVTPVVPECKHNGHSHQHQHKYKIGRFKEGKWLIHEDQEMVQYPSGCYTLKGVRAGAISGAKTPPHTNYTPHPKGKFGEAGTPYCKWELQLPSKIHQLRLLSILKKDRPIFTGDPHGKAVDRELKAISALQVFEYSPDPKEPVAIIDSKGKKVELDYSPDEYTQSVNLHIWAQIEDESGMSDQDAIDHARCATKALVALFRGLNMAGNGSVATDNSYGQQLPMPEGLRFVELMTLGERFAMTGSRRSDFAIMCTPRTCGGGGNIYVNG